MYKNTPGRTGRRVSLPVFKMSMNFTQTAKIDTHEFVRYLLASVFALSADAGSLFAMVQWLGINYLYAGAIAFMFGIAVIYVLSIVWVFTQRSSHSYWIEFAIFLLIGVCGLGITELVLLVGSGLLGAPLLLSKLVSVCVVFAWNFAARKLLLFR